jgi:hypothetical protein
MLTHVFGSVLASRRGELFFKALSEGNWIAWGFFILGLGDSSGGASIAPGTRTAPRRDGKALNSCSSRGILGRRKDDLAENPWPLSSSREVDVPEFMKISRAFRIGKKNSGNYSGIVVASPDAFYLVVGQNAVRAGMVAGGGLLGGLLASYLDKRSGKKSLVEASSGVIETDLADLPVDVTGHREWPVKAQEGPVLVVPREAIQSTRYSFWQWGIFLQTKEIEFRIEPPFFGRKRLLNWLREIGWEV